MGCTTSKQSEIIQPKRQREKVIPTQAEIDAYEEQQRQLSFSYANIGYYDPVTKQWLQPPSQSFSSVNPNQSH